MGFTVVLQPAASSAVTSYKLDIYMYSLRLVQTADVCCTSGASCRCILHFWCKVPMYIALMM